MSNVDFGVVKNTALRERMSLEFRAEFFNLLNRANFTNPAASRCAAKTRSRHAVNLRGKMTP